MVKVSTLFKLMIEAFLVFTLGYFLVVDSSFISDHNRLIETFFVASGIVMAIYVYQRMRKTEELSHAVHFVLRYLIFFIPSVVVIALLSAMKYKYGVSAIISVLTPYLYLFYAFPLIYIYYIDGGIDKFLKKVMIMVIGILIIKSMVFYLYNYRGITLFPKLLFQYAGWTRDGIQRVDGGYLFGFILCYVFYNLFSKKRKTLYLILMTFMSIYLVLVTRFRFQTIACVLTFIAVYYTSGRLKGKQNVNVLILLAILSFFVAFGGVEKILESFSLQGAYGGSSNARINTLVYYWNLIWKQKAIFGLGLFDQTNINVQRIVTINSRTKYWLEDLGIIGGFFRFGLLGFLVYGKLFYDLTKIALLNLRYSRILKDPQILFVIGIIAYMILSCLGLNFFDVQRAVDVPFYLGTISYLVWEMSLPKEQ